MTQEAGVRSRSRLPGTGFWLFLFLAGVYLLSYSGGLHSIDEVSVAAMTESLVKQGRVSTDQILWSQGWTPSQGRFGPDGHLYSKKGLGSALLGAPFYWLALRLPNAGGVQALMLAGALVTALTGWLLYASVRLLGYDSRVAVLTALGFGLGTMAWPYARYFFSEPLTALGLMLALWGLLSYRKAGQARYAVLAGTGLGVALLAKVANVVTWPLFLVYGFWIAFRCKQASPESVESSGRQEKGLLLFSASFLLPLVAAGLVLAAYNVARTGTVLDLGYATDETFATPLWQGVAGLLVSPGKGLFLYSPILLAALLGIPGLLRRDRTTALLSLGVVIAYVLLYAGWFMWWGGWSWGPRFLVPVLPFLSLFLAPVVDWVLHPDRWWAKALLAALALLSFGVQFLGVTVDFNQYLLLLYQRGLDHGEINFRPGLSPLLGHWRLFRDGLSSSLGLGAQVEGPTASWDVAWARNLPGGIDWPRLLWPFVLILVVLAGVYLIRKTQGQQGGRNPVGRWLLAGAGLGLLAVSMLTAARLSDAADDWQAGTRALSETLQEAAQPGDILIVDLLPYASHLELATALLERYKADPPYWGWARQEPVSAERQTHLAALDRDYRWLWLGLDTTPEADPASTTERWLDEHAFRVESRWLSPAMRLVRYRLPSGSMADGPEVRLDLQVGDRLWLDGYSADCDAPCQSNGQVKSQAGQALGFSLFWRAEESVSEDYVTFVQLLDQEGRLRVQEDRMPVGGFRPTSTWGPGEEIRDNYGLELPSDLPPGDYQLIVGLYLPATMERLIVRGADGVQLGDYAPLMVVTIVGEEGP